MTRASSSLRLRWTDRDEQVVRFCSEQWCVDFEAISLLCGTRRRRTYELIERWRDDFRALRSVSIRPDRHDKDVTVIWPHRAVAAEQLGRSVSGWNPSRTNIVHKLAVSRLRAALCGLESGLWIPERTLLRDAAIAAAHQSGKPIVTNSAQGTLFASKGFARPHVHDGRYWDGDRWLAIEVELTLKRPSLRRLAAVVFEAYQQAQSRDAGLLYLSGSDRIARALIRAVEDLIAAGRLPREPDIQISDLQRVIAARSIDLPREQESHSS